MTQNHDVDDLFEQPTPIGVAPIQQRNDEEIAVSSKDAIKSIFSPRNKKSLIAVGGAGVLLIGALIYTFTSTPEPIKSRGSGVQGGLASSRSTSDDYMVEKSILEYNQERLPEVQETNQFAHPLLSSAKDEPKETPAATTDTTEEVAEVANPLVQTTAQPRRTQAQRQQQRSYTEEEIKHITSMFADVISAEGAAPKAQSVVWTYQPKQTQQQGANTATTRTGRTTQASRTAAEPSAPMCKRRVRAGSQLYATSDLALNSDVGGEVAFTIHSGELRNYKMLGSFERKDEWIRIELNRLVPKSGMDNVEIQKINAIALDLDTTLNAVQGEVDRHILYRYGWWGFGTVLSAIGKAAELAADRDVYYVDNAVVENVQTNSSREVRIALGELGQNLGKQFQNNINRPITISIRQGEQVGIFLLDDICVD